MDKLDLQPHSIEAEQGLLACCMLGLEPLLEAQAQGVTFRDFYKTSHKQVFRLLEAMAADGAEDICEIELFRRLQADEELSEEIGGIEAIYAIQNAVETTTHSRYFIKVVLETSMARKLIRECRLAIENAHAASDGQIAEQVGKLEGKIHEIGQGAAQSDSMVSAAESVAVVRKKVKEQLENPEQVFALMQTQLTDLNNVLPSKGFLEGQLVVIAARPSVGKTAIAMNFAEYNAVDLGNPVLVFSLETTHHELTKRMAFSRARVNTKDLDNRTMRRADMLAVEKAMKEIEGSQLIIDDYASTSVHMIRAKAFKLANKLKRKGQRLHGIVVDYLQLVKTDDSRVSREQQVAEMSRTLKILAGDLRCPVFALSQLNRGNEKENREPRLSDLRESGAIEQDADIVILLHPIKDPNAYPNPNFKVVKLIHAKVRNGPVGSFLTTFECVYTRYVNHAPEPAPAQPPKVDRAALEQRYGRRGE